MENNNLTSNTNTLIERVRNVFTATETMITEMKMGDRSPIKAIAAQVGLTIGVEPNSILCYVNDFAHNTSMGYVSAGKFGGFIKGERRLKAAKIVQTETIPAATIPDLNQE